MNQASWEKQLPPFTRWDRLKARLYPHLMRIQYRYGRRGECGCNWFLGKKRAMCIDHVREYWRT